MQTSLEQSAPGDAAVPRLELYWYELTPGEERGASSGELVGSVHRLYEVQDELQSATRLRDVRARLRRVAFAVENYLSRAFELRERSIRLLALVTGDEKGAKQVRHPERRTRAFHGLMPKAPILVKRTQRLFKILDNDVMLRNMHTHEQFLGLGLFTGHNVYDPDDALTDVEHDSKAFKALAKILNTGMRRLRREYLVRIKQIADAALDVADAADPNRASRF